MRRTVPELIRVKSGLRSCWFIAARFEVVGAFVGLEDVDEPADRAQHALYGSLARFAEHSCQLPLRSDPRFSSRSNSVGSYVPRCGVELKLEIFPFWFLGAAELALNRNQSLLVSRISADFDRTCATAHAMRSDPLWQRLLPSSMDPDGYSDLIPEDERDFLVKVANVIQETLEPLPISSRPS